MAAVLGRDVEVFRRDRIYATEFIGFLRHVIGFPDFFVDYTEY